MITSGITWHDLRHTFGTRLRGQGVHEIDIMQLMGHSSVGVTADYAHATPSVIQSAVNKLAEPREARWFSSPGRAGWVRSRHFRVILGPNTLMGKMADRGGMAEILIRTHDVR